MTHTQHACARTRGARGRVQRHHVLEHGGEEAAQGTRVEETVEEASLVKDDPEKLQAVAFELADILQYLIRIADVLGVDLAESLWAKLELNDLRYPADRSRGTAAKYTDL